MDQYARVDNDRTRLLSSAAPIVQAFPGNIWIVHLIIPLEDGKIDKPPAPGFSSSNTASWISLEDAIEQALRYPPGEAGVSFTIPAGMISFDFDDCVAPDGTVAPEIAALIVRLDSFTYRTVSGRGMRVVCRNKATDGVPPGKYTRWSEGGHKVEIFVGQHNTYNTFSATEANGRQIARRTGATRELLDEWLGSGGGKGGVSSGTGNLGEIGVTSDLGKRARDQDALLDALAAIPHDEAIDRELWVKIGEAFYAGTGGSEQGREAFIAWSETWIHHNENPRRDDSEDAEALWNSFAASLPRTIGAGTVFKLAQQHGWKWPEEKLEFDQADETAATPPETEVMPPRLSEAALARRFARLHCKQLRYVAEWGKWFWWDGTIWAGGEGTAEKVLDAVGLFLQEMAATCTKATQARNITKTSTTQAVMRRARARSELLATAEQWDADPWLLNTPGGVVDLRTGKLRPHRAADYMTKITAVAPDPAHSCPRRLQFLDEIMAGDKSMIDYLQRECGYSLTGDISEEMLNFGHGPGANGKSKFVELRLWIMGGYAIEAPMETFTASKNENHPTDLARLRGARLVVASETEAGKHWAENRIKMLTGSKYVTGRFMRQDYVTFERQCKLFIVGNHKPRLRNIDVATRRRFRLIPFNVIIPVAQRDKKLAEKLQAEGPGILAWMIEGAACCYKQGGLPPPKAVQAATESYLEDEDTLGNWLAECCETGAGLSESTRALYGVYETWMRQRGEHRWSSETQFVVALTDRGFTKRAWTNHRKPREIDGLRLKEIEPQGAEKGEADL